MSSNFIIASLKPFNEETLSSSSHTNKVRMTIRDDRNKNRKKERLLNFLIYYLERNLLLKYCQEKYEYINCIGNPQRAITETLGISLNNDLLHHFIVMWIKKKEGCTTTAIRLMILTEECVLADNRDLWPFLTCTYVSTYALTFSFMGFIL
uniref:Uncharacterized protein n=1 Tax=Glossina pallidipes TaxID=7398 RepID=A0A1B0A419_GLOPL